MYFYVQTNTYLRELPVISGCSPLSNYIQKLMQYNILTTKFFLLFSFLLTSSCVFGQAVQKRYHLDMRSGITTGSPIIIRNIPDGATGKPGIGFNAGLEFTYRIFPRISITLGAAYAEKGSSFTSPVSGKYDAARGVFGERFPFPLRVKYTGSVAANFNMTYIDFPVMTNVHFKKWQMGMGYQYSTMLTGKFDGAVDVKALLLNFKDQQFDESENIKDYDHALILKVGRQMSKRLLVAVNIAVSTQRLLIQPEEGFSNPRNVFANLLVGFRIL